MGLVLVGVGCWAFSEKNRLTEGVDVDSLQSRYSDVFNVVFDLTVLIIVLGVVIFALSFVGCVGALRENTCFLKCVRIILYRTFRLPLLLTNCSRRNADYNNGIITQQRR